MRFLYGHHELESEFFLVQYERDREYRVLIDLRNFLKSAPCHFTDVGVHALLHSNLLVRTFLLS